MKTIFDKTNRDKFTVRIKALNEKNTAQWGKMNVYQMLQHCTIWEEWILGKHNPVYKQSFMGILFGKMALKSMIKEDGPLKRNIPSSAQLLAREKNGDIELAKNKWITLIEDYPNFSNPNFVHDFFGKMTPEQIGVLAYKHTDHYLRQFER